MGKKLNSFKSLPGRQSLTRRTKTAKNQKADITFAAHCHNVTVLLSNISLFDFLLF